MEFDAAEVKRKYTGELPIGYGKGSLSSLGEWAHYLASISITRAFRFGARKRYALRASHVKEGDAVIVFCCGTGDDFPHILERTGDAGRILGVDFSPAMLEVARDRVGRAAWSNVDLLEADVTEFENESDSYFDCGICTLGMSIIPEWRKAYHNLLSHVKPGGEVIIGDLQLATGWRSLINAPIMTWVKKYGGSYEGHKNSRELFSLMERGLSEVSRQEYSLGSYCCCIGKKP